MFILHQDSVRQLLEPPLISLLQEETLPIQPTCMDELTVKELCPGLIRSTLPFLYPALRYLFPCI